MGAETINPINESALADVVACQVAAQTGELADTLQTGVMSEGASIALLGTGDEYPAHESLVMPAQQAFGMTREAVAALTEGPEDVITLGAVRAQKGIEQANAAVAAAQQAQQGFGGTEAHAIAH